MIAHRFLVGCLAFLVVFDCYAILGFVVYDLLQEPGPIPKEAWLLLGAIVGHVVTLAGIVINWAFGSTRGNAQQTDLIAQALAATPPARPEIPT
jgi:hypothetical protein